MTNTSTEMLWTRNVAKLSRSLAYHSTHNALPYLVAPY